MQHPWLEPRTCVSIHPPGGGHTGLWGGTRPASHGQCVTLRDMGCSDNAEGFPRRDVFHDGLSTRTQSYTVPIPSKKGHPPAAGVRQTGSLQLSGSSLATLFSGDPSGAEQGGETKTGDPAHMPRALELPPGPAHHSHGPCCRSRLPPLLPSKL